jgi:hypothetical protein
MVTCTFISASFVFSHTSIKPPVRIDYPNGDKATPCPAYSGPRATAAYLVILFWACYESVATGEDDIEVAVYVGFAGLDLVGGKKGPHIHLTLVVWAVWVVARVDYDGCTHL